MHPLASPKALLVRRSFGRYNSDMCEQEQTQRERRLELARKAFREFSAKCFWSWPEDTEITEEIIPLIIRGLRLHGGHQGYKIAAELCQ